MLSFSERLHSLLAVPSFSPDLMQVFVCFQEDIGRTSTTTSGREATLALASALAAFPSSFLGEGSVLERAPWSSGPPEMIAVKLLL
ncbi:hypothetical protein XENOCAPTIV_000081, partial [Xenoophorus captivus]